MAQIYEENLWGGDKTEFYSGSGSHLPELVDPYVETLSAFLKAFETPPVVCDLGCGDFNVGKELVKHSKIYFALEIVPELTVGNKK